MNKLVWMAFSQIALLSMTACGPQGKGEVTELMTLSMDGSLVGKVGLKSCTGSASCQANEMILVHVPDGKPFEKGYQADGFISSENDSLLWNSAGKKAVVIGKITNKVATALCNGEFEQVCDLALTITHPNDPSAPKDPFRLATFRLRDHSETPPSGGSETPSSGGSETPPSGGSETPPSGGSETPPSGGSETPPKDDPNTSRVTSLLEFVIPAPNQEGAGTCNLMAATGAMEILLNQWKKANNQAVDTKINGTSDLSEPYTINSSNSLGYGNTLTPILAYNKNGNQAILSKDFPFVNSFYGLNAGNNWNSQTPAVSKVKVPSFKMENIFGGTTASDNSKWAVTILDESHIEAVKKELRADRPVLVTYNHNGYWHVVVVVGYDDEKFENCQLVRGLVNSGSALGAKVRAAMQSDGGCRKKGVFYVRDSLGMSARAPKYEIRSYDWLKYLGNHIFSVHL